MVMANINSPIALLISMALRGLQSRRPLDKYTQVSPSDTYPGELQQTTLDVPEFHLSSGLPSRRPLDKYLGELH